jgi:Transposase, Mutator family
LLEFRTLPLATALAAEPAQIDVVTSEHGAAWLAFLRSLVARGLTGVRLAPISALEPG